MLRWLLSLAIALPMLASDVRQLYVANDFDAAIRAYKAMASPSEEDRAFAIASLASSGRRASAKRELEALQKSAPQSQWTAFAAALVTNSQDDPTTALAAGERMMALAGPEPDEEMTRLFSGILHGAGKKDEAVALLVRAKQTPRVRASLASLYTFVNKAEESAAIYEALRKENPDFLEGWYGPGRNALYRRKFAEALPLLEYAAALSTTPRVHGEYWRAIASAPDLTAEQKKEKRERAIADLVARRGNDPEVWSAIAAEYERSNEPEKAAEWSERTLREAPHTVYAARAMWSRTGQFARPKGPTWVEDAAARAEMKKRIREYLAYETDDEDYNRGNAYGTLFQIAKNEPDMPEAELVEIIEHVLADAKWNQGLYADAAILLADRGVRLDLAEDTARQGFDLLKKNVLPDEGEYTDRLRAWMHDALGWVLLKKGELALARNQLFASEELYDTALTHYHLGQWHEAQKQYDKAEQRYRRGLTMQMSWTNPNEAALAKLYERRHGSMAGYEAYRKQSEQVSTKSRRATILETRRKNPKPATDFKLKTLDGKEVSLASLKGKTAVINFWGIWCSWCVREMPDYQKLAKKYANDPHVAILTINNDGDAQSVRKWMAEKKYDFAVLLDEGWVQRTNITAFPTTWFLDKQGRIAFEHKGWTKELVDEFSWRVEALRQ